VRVSTGGLVEPLSLLPQQATLPSVLSPHDPLIWPKLPAAGVLSPKTSSPQHATVLSVLIPHVYM
jgi:hypothetical protein